MLSPVGPEVRAVMFVVKLAVRSRSAARVAPMEAGQPVGFGSTREVPAGGAEQTGCNRNAVCSVFGAHSNRREGRCTCCWQPIRLKSWAPKNSHHRLFQGQGLGCLVSPAWSMPKLMWFIWTSCGHGTPALYPKYGSST